MLRLAGTLLSSVLLYVSFAPFEHSAVAWFALIPLLLVFFFSTPRDSFAYGYVSGLIFWLLSIFWLNHVTVAGWFALSAYCAVYFGAAGFLISWFAGLHGVTSPYKNMALLFVVPVLWIGLEWIRGVFATGFPWNYIGISQYRSLPLIQIAQFGGVYLVSFLVVMVNAGFALTVARYCRYRKFRYRPPHTEIMTAVLALAFCIALGARLAALYRPSGRLVNVALVQPNVPQVLKWCDSFLDTIYDRLRSGTLAALEDGSPDLIVWPETALPDFLRDSRRSQAFTAEIASHGVPILIGGMDVDWSGAEPAFFNSSFLWEPGAGVSQKYDKCHLVLFGEYVPFDRYLPFVSALTPIEGSFAAGKTNTVFVLPGNGARFSSLICFEDIMAGLARNSVRNGAQFLVNQTNDGWFDGSAASRQHMAHCVFRCVETRVPAARAANTGITCFIDRTGRIYGELPPGPGAPAAFFSRQSVYLPEPGAEHTFFVRHGAVFGSGSALFVLLSYGFFFMKKMRSRNGKN